MLRQGMHIHLVGIGGFGLSAIARVLLGQGYSVSGSDLNESALLEALAAEGAVVTVGHSAAAIGGADLILISSAIPPENPEVVAARAAGIPVVKRAEFLGDLMAGHTTIAVAGTHGKTTTTAMMASVLLEADFDPSFIIGGLPVGLGTNARAGRGGIFLIEADEYDRMFLGLQPQAAILTTVEYDHPDCYPTEGDMTGAYRQFVGGLPADGLLVACLDDRGATRMGRGREQDGGLVRWYGSDPQASWSFSLFEESNGGAFTVLKEGTKVGPVHLRVPGRHNALNALAVIALADWLRIPYDTTAAVLACFEGVERRFEVKGEVNGVIVVDDYAHHPTEIAATLAAARAHYSDRRIWAVLQPHTFSRTRAFLGRFASSFGDADEVIVLDIYAAREMDVFGISSTDLVDRMEHPSARYIGDRRQAAAYLAEHLQRGDLLLTMGAGDGYRVGEWVLGLMRARRNGANQVSVDGAATHRCALMERNGPGD